MTALRRKEINATDPEKFAKQAFVLSAVFICALGLFGYGLFVGHLQIWPYYMIRATASAAFNLAVFGDLGPVGRRVEPPVHASRKAMIIHDASNITKGYYVFVGWDSNADVYAAWLYDEIGEKHHTWAIDYASLDSDGPLNEVDNPHPFSVLEDGSIIVGFDKGDIMARLDACGAPVWIKKGIYHHSLSRAEDGSFWVWRGDGGTAYGHFNYMENFDANTGNTIREIGLIEDIIKASESSSLIFGVSPDYEFRKFDSDPQDKSDLFHPNDIDVLSSELAPKFPLFEPGDMLLSFRTINLVAVLDPNTYSVKWWSHGPWIQQHDPDFTADGRISVYDNNTGRGKSRILKIDPQSRVVENRLFNGNLEFYSPAMGKHQYLPTGNVLIAIPGEGRIVEVTKDGNVVMEFNNVSSASHRFNEHVENAVWIPGNYFNSIPSCSQ